MTVFPFHVGLSEKKDLPYTTDFNIDICTVVPPVPYVTVFSCTLFPDRSNLTTFIHDHIIRVLHFK